MKRVMFVCMGNICRSPLAEAVFNHVVVKHKATDRYVADSSGTIGYHAGEHPDPRMQTVASGHGVEMSHRAQKLTRKHLEAFDLILCMDRNNLKDARALARTAEEKEKVVLFRDFDPEGTGDVPDPYYGGMDGFETVFTMAMRTAQALFNTLETSS